MSSERKVMIGESTYRRTMNVVRAVEASPVSLVVPSRRRVAASATELVPVKVVGYDETEHWHLADVYASGIGAQAWNGVPGSVATEEDVPLRLIGQDEEHLRIPDGTWLPACLLPWIVGASSEAQWTVIHPFSGVMSWVGVTGPHPDMGTSPVFVGDLYDGAASTPAIMEDVTVFLVGATVNDLDVWQAADWTVVPRVLAARAYRSWQPGGGLPLRTELVYEANGWFLLS